MWDPIRGAPHIMVIAEAITANMEPAFGNFRCDCAEALEKYSGHDFWFGFEQEYVLCDESGTPLSTAGGDPYCGRGASALPEHMREIMNDHYAMCLGAGIFIAGMNLEQGPAQGEFQIVGRGMTPVDQMIAARHILHKAAQKYRIAVSFEAYHPEVGHSSGLHVNVSTRQTRGDGGLTVIEKCCRALARKAEDAKKCYGVGNEERLSGKGDTSELNTFRFAVADRGASIRIPRQVGITGKGYFEDRRPSANADPYRVAAHIVKACGDILSRIN
jgi:glutamine synthetase